MISNLLPLPFVLPMFFALLYGLLALLARGFVMNTGAAYRRLGLLASVVYLVVAIKIAHQAQSKVLIYAFADWPIPAAISYVADKFSALMLVLSAVSVFLVHLIYPFGSDDSPMAKNVLHWILFHGMLAGIHGAFLTGDLFNLFVAFEIFLIFSYGIVLSTTKSYKAAAPYLFLNLLASVLFLFSQGYLYGVMGTLNMADLAVRIQNQLYLSPHVHVIFVSLSLVALLKAGAAPFFQWLPDTYSQIPSGMAAFFSALLTKVGVYCLIRFGLTIFPEVSIHYGPILWSLGLLSVFVGVLCALGQRDFKRLLAFHTISQIGFILVGVGFVFEYQHEPFSEIILLGVILYVVHHSLVKSSLFALSSCLETVSGSSDLFSSRGYYSAIPWVAWAFVFAGFSLSGLPPSSGFYAKFQLFHGLALSKQYWVLVLLMLGSLLTLASMMKVWVQTMTGKEEHLGENLNHLSKLKKGILIFALASWAFVSSFFVVNDWVRAASHELMYKDNYSHIVFEHLSYDLQKLEKSRKKLSPEKTQ